jgi:hypothetical protein
MGKLKSLKHPKVFIPLIIILLIIAAFVSAIVHLNSPAEGTVINSPQNDSQNNSQADAANQNYSDSTLSFQYPGKFEVKPAQANPGYIDTISLITKQRHDEFVSIGVYKSTLANDSGVRFRTDRPQEYKVVSSTSGEMVFSKNDSREYTGFLQRGENVVSISFTSVSANDMARDYNTVSNSVQLR